MDAGPEPGSQSGALARVASDAAVARDDVIDLVRWAATSFLACIVGAVSAWAGGIDPGTPQLGIGAGIYGSAVQVPFGFIMLSAVAPMSMSEERQRGSLDLLAATALSSREIVVGKWLGAYRMVVLLTIGPGLVAIALATAAKAPPTVMPGISPIYYTEISRAECWLGAAMVFLTVLAHGSLITSVGLALAMWIKRQDRAIGMGVFAFVFVAMGWPILVQFRPESQGLSYLSPLVSLMVLISVVSDSTSSRGSCRRETATDRSHSPAHTRIPATR